MGKGSEIHHPTQPIATQVNLTILQIKSTNITINNLKEDADGHNWT